MEKFSWVLIVLFAGAMLPVQAGLNGRMGKCLDSPEWAVLISFFIGTVTMLIFLVVTRSPVPLQKMTDIPATSLMAGVLAAIYVTTVVLAFPKLGAALTFGLVVAGQLTISLLLDHFKILVQTQHPINAYRLIGLLLIALGIFIFRRY